MEPNEFRNKRETLMVLETILEAIDRREEIFRAVEGTESREDALLAIGKVLDVGSVRALAVLNMQVHHWTRSARAMVVEQTGTLTRELESVRD